MNLKKQKSKLIEELKLMGIKNPEVLDAIEQTPRELFVQELQKHLAYENFPLDIGFQQTISQPYTVAFMLELLCIKKGHKILEVGAGSGYNSAVMSYLTGKKGKVLSLELEKYLCEFASSNLKKVNISNVKIIHSDGFFGFEKEAPFDRIILTAASKEIPKSLISQLKIGGIMVLPLTNVENRSQIMTRIVKVNSINLKITEHGYFLFVPMRYRHSR